MKIDSFVKAALPPSSVAALGRSPSSLLPRALFSCPWLRAPGLVFATLDLALRLPGFAGNGPLSHAKVWLAIAYGAWVFGSFACASLCYASSAVSFFFALMGSIPIVFLHSSATSIALRIA